MILKQIKNHNRIFISLFPSVLFIAGFMLTMLMHVNLSRRTFTYSLNHSVVPTVANTISANMREANQRSAVIVKLFEDAFSEKLLKSALNDAGGITGFLSYWADSLDVKNIGFVSLETDTYYDSFGQIHSLDYESERDAWITGFLDSPAVYQFNFYEPEEPGSAPLYSIFHDRKIIDDSGKVLGIVGIGLDLDYIDPSEGNLENTISISFLDSSWNYRLPLEKRGQNVNDLFEITEKEYIEAIPRTDGSRRLLLYFMPLSELDRIMMIEVDITSYLQDYRLQTYRVLIMGVLLAFLIVLVNFIFIYLSSRKMSRRAYTDALTKCYNRAFAEKLIDRRLLQDNLEYTLMVFDIDRFKIINDLKGHAEGDSILRSVSKIASAHLRRDDFLIRWGGDEFVAILQTGVKNSAVIAERIRLSIEERTEVTVSIGISEFGPETGFDDSFRNADRALYRSKESGRNSVFIDSSVFSGQYTAAQA